MKPDFDRAEKLATRLLLRQIPQALYVDVRKLHFDIPICFDSLQNFVAITGENVLALPGADVMLQDGCTLPVLQRGIYIILFNRTAKSNPERLNWTLAHEVGHIYLGHTDDGEKEEKEAHWFAAQLLMQENIVRDVMAHGIDAFDLSQLFRVSYSAAAKRITSLNRKFKWFSDYEERELLAKYRPLEYKALYDLRASRIAN